MCYTLKKKYLYVQWSWMKPSLDISCRCVHVYLICFSMCFHGSCKWFININETPLARAISCLWRHRCITFFKCHVYDCFYWTYLHMRIIQGWKKIFLVLKMRNKERDEYPDLYCLWLGLNYYVRVCECCFYRKFSKAFSALGIFCLFTQWDFVITEGLNIPLVTIHCQAFWIDYTENLSKAATRFSFSLFKDWSVWLPSKLFQLILNNM